ncbi:MAG: hypothetical protein AAGH19_11805 [Pseudomonadota bacterium]
MSDLPLAGLLFIVLSAVFGIRWGLENRKSETGDAVQLRNYRRLCLFFAALAVLHFVLF